MKAEQLAAQLYTVRDHLKTPADIAKSLARIRAIGYRGVELAGLGPIADAELRSVLDGEGLVCVSAHQPGSVLFGQTADVIARMKALKCPAAVYPYPSGDPMRTTQEVLLLAGKLQGAGRALAAEGLALLYHNHNMELRRIDGRLVLDLILEQTEARTLGAELDTYWIQAGGGDPVAWCRKLYGRLPILHMKDYGVADSWESVPVSVFKEVGSGNLDWPRIVAAAEESGCQAFVVEQDSNWKDGDPFESLKMSFQYISAHLCR